jgi:hypothetical protein
MHFAGAPAGDGKSPPTGVLYRVNNPSRMALVTACAELTQSSL